MNRRYEKQPLKEGKLILYIDQDCKRIEAVYHIQKIIGQGRSCLVYDASYIDNIGLEHKVRIKECYPDGIDIVRDKNGNIWVAAFDMPSFIISFVNKQPIEYSLDALRNRVGFNPAIMAVCLHRR